ncbi:hypothetical protein CI105_03310 [Candidatus Izimaplasma bacterium ZiA1]|nr:hypothetical protein CI105_03310 [Candidatus Izimaplasma bacterium ZiA1]
MVEYLLDTGNYDEIKDVLDFYNIKGITTNPTILSRESGSYLSILKKLDKLLDGKQFHIQLTSTLYNDMIEEAKALKALIKSDLYIKIAVSKDGLKAIKFLSENNYNVTATAITNMNQGIMAAVSGAKYLAVYVNRTSSTGVNGNDIVKNIEDILARDNVESKVLGASYKSVYQVNESILKGAKCVTVPKDIFIDMMTTELTEKSIRKFTIDIKSKHNLTGKGLLKG